MSNYLLFGNPNVGKTSVFNYLTNSNENVSNFEGVTVTKKSSDLCTGKGCLVDVPGVYSINSFTIANDVSQHSLLCEPNDGIIDVLNINDLKRNMYLLIDLLETGKPVNAILNLDDLFNGSINIDKLSTALSINIFKTNHKNYKYDLTDVEKFKNNKFKLDYGYKVEEMIDNLIPLIHKDTNNIDKRFFAIQFLQGDDHLLSYFKDSNLALEYKQELASYVESNNLARSISGFIFSKRRIYVNNLLKETYTREIEKDEMPFMNNTFDKYALHKVWGFIIFLFVMYLVFFVAVKGGFLQDVVDGWVGAFSEIVELTLINYGVGEALISFIVNGAIAGVGAILVFLPQIIILFTMLTFFESIGYFSRVNALFENLFNKIGISSSSMVPFISGFGCNVIGIMGTRTIQSEKKRIATIMASPFISCSARLPVYLIFVEIFFTDNQTIVLLFLYILGIVVAILVAFVIDKLIYSDDEIQTIISLPKYKKVRFNYFARLTFIKVKSFITKAGSLIFVGSLGLWFVSSFGLSGYTTDINNSFVGILANQFNWLLTPLGFGTVPAFGALIVSFLAKELAISALIVMYGATSIETLTPILQSQFSPASALSFMVFILLYIPCLATIGAIYSETKKIKYPIYSILISLVIGYTLSFVVYHIGLFIF